MEQMKYATPLKKNEYGQIDDDRAKEIEETIKASIQEIFDKYEDVLPYDIEFLIHRQLAYMASIQTLKVGAKMKEKNKELESN